MSSLSVSGRLQKENIVPNDFTFLPQQVQELMSLLNLQGCIQITQVRQFNHTYRITCQKQTFYLKLHTKDWYPPDDAETGYSARHEASAWNILTRHGLATPRVELLGVNRNNSLGRAFLLTREVPGKIMQDILLSVSLQELFQMLHEVGVYLCRMHAIKFAYAGYIIDEGPVAPPDEDAWQHPIWTLSVAEHALQEWVQLQRDKLSTSLFAELEQKARQAHDLLAPSYAVPCFTQGDCGIDQIMVMKEQDHWRVSALLDMEVASAGDCISDIVSLCVSLAQVLPETLYWWQPLFEGYGEVPDFEGFRIRLLRDWYPFDANIWPGTGENMITHLLHAQNWEPLFSRSHL